MFSTIQAQPKQIDKTNSRMCRPSRPVLHAKTLSTLQLSVSHILTTSILGWLNFTAHLTGFRIASAINLCVSP